MNLLVCNFPIFVKVVASNTCGINGPEIYYRQTQDKHSTWGQSGRSLRYTCDEQGEHRKLSQK